MNAGDWIAVASPGLLVAGAVIAATAKMTRLTVAVETLTKAVTGDGGLVQRVEDHELRLTKGGL